ncbi:hypothetical protein IW152_005736 [Coemansia sp. BCRC 34962]|nr:hypothetical protein IW152_005736 [Coemansia sp. BCRC 34962]
MHTYILSLALLVAFVATALAASPLSDTQLACRTAARNDALLVRTYGDQDVIDLQCHATGSPTVNRTAEWLRTSDSCYVPALFVELDAATHQQLPKCTDIDRAQPCVLPNLAGFELLERQESFQDHPQTDPLSGLTFIGFRHQCEPGACPRESISKMEATVLLWQDIRNTTACLAQMLSGSVSPRARLVLNDNMWSALASWAFSIGCDQAAQSPLIKRVRNGEPLMAVVAAELPKWNSVDGKTVARLTARRGAELSLFRIPSLRRAYPRCDHK